MRGINDSQGYMWTYISPEQRVPKDHSLRVVKVYADTILKGMSQEFDAMHNRKSRPSIP